MVYWRIAEYLERMPKPRWTRYRLVQESGLAPMVVYRVSRKGAPAVRIDGRTLDALCTALGATPGDLLEHVPKRTKQRR
jgi:DNA-binding Xre family transcriptional regulator